MAYYFLKIWIICASLYFLDARRDMYLFNVTVVETSVLYCFQAVRKYDRRVSTSTKRIWSNWAQLRALFEYDRLQWAARLERAKAAIQVRVCVERFPVNVFNARRNTHFCNQAVIKAAFWNRLNSAWKDNAEFPALAERILSYCP